MNILTFEDIDLAILRVLVILIAIVLRLDL